MCFTLAQIWGSFHLKVFRLAFDEMHKMIEGAGCRLGGVSKSGLLKVDDKCSRQQFVAKYKFTGSLLK
jgi:hypothetical protein